MERDHVMALDFDPTLDAVDPAGFAAADAAREWLAYLSLWTTGNHVRTVAPLLGSVLLLVGLRYR